MRGYVCQRIGHGGASALAPANTLASFDAAVDVGVDVVEFDVRARGRELVLAHTLLHARRPGCLSLRKALVHLASARFAGVDLNVDLKHLGCEAVLLAELRSTGLLARTLVSCQVPTVLDRVRSLEPRVRVAISIGGRVARLSRRWRDWRTQALCGLEHTRWEGICAQHRLIDRELLESVEQRHGLLYAWTVNDRSAIASLRRLGVHGITTADPRLFA